jgi:hypothetical protein
MGKPSQVCRPLHVVPRPANLPHSTVTIRSSFLTVPFPTTPIYKLLLWVVIYKMGLLRISFFAGIVLLQGKLIAGWQKKGK